MTRAALLSDCYRRLNFAASPDSTVTTRLTAFLDETLQELYGDPVLAPVLARYIAPLTVASVANQATYATRMPHISSMVDRTNDRRLDMQTPDWWRAVLPDPTAITGTPTTWIPLGFSAVAVQPSDASEIFVDSTSASDTGTAYLEGRRTGGGFTSLSVTMTGVTAVTLSAAITDIVEITQFYLSVAAVGTVTLHEDAEGGTELARIDIGSQHGRYQAFALYPTPAGILTYHIDGEPDAPAALTSDSEEPAFPPRFHPVLVHGAMWREFEKKDDDRAASAYRHYQTAVSQMRHALSAPADYLPVSGGRNTTHTRFGAWTPVTRY